MRFLIIFLPFIVNNCFGQCKKSQSFDSTIFCKPLIKKTDTIYFKATYNGIGKIAQSDYINKLNSKGIISKKNYSSAIEFVPLGNIQKLYLPFNDFLNEKNYEKLRVYMGQNQTICIRGIVHKGYEKWNRTIFFLVDRIDF